MIQFTAFGFKSHLSSPAFGSEKNHAAFTTMIFDRLVPLLILLQRSDLFAFLLFYNVGNIAEKWFLCVLFYSVGDVAEK